MKHPSGSAVAHGGDTQDCACTASPPADLGHKGASALDGFARTGAGACIRLRKSVAIKHLASSGNKF
ncbi:hypothetical protein B4U84_05510 [Westiellopsis prolifica IICB1]|nr:hypothetical protein B4U84_05510 [Westiellopsis prolifica IICB1]